MSADNFQTKYSSVMESMLKAAIAETTKLFETMVDELKAEISNMKKENEELKTRCCQFASERNQPTVCIISGERELLPGPSDGTEQRDQAIQCDLVPFRMMQVEQCQPLNHLEIDNTLHDHNYGEGATQMAIIVVKQEDSDDSSSHSVMKQEEVEPMEVCGQVSGDQPDPPQASACATETEGHPINQESSTGVITMPQKETPMTEQPKVIQEKVSLSSEGSTPVKVSTPNFENSTLAINTTKPRIVSGGVGLPTSNEDKDIIEFGEQDLASPNDQPTKKKSSAAIIHLTPITTKDMPSPHSQMTKAQFLAQLAVKPITEDPTKASSNYSMDATASNADTRTGVKKSFTQSAHLKKHVKNVHKIP
ncbi:hypothetical protein PBY51_020584 [Eleginops maclovinus]|uniref:Uncharacterized protein n=1 Tax=Eleginops maclovinus TaxID=56733 RepID=A0AAN7XMS5_ELEMC|nr:hypothetical protein PBY51_020584 [Eleginops maclovinus]